MSQLPQIEEASIQSATAVTKLPAHVPGCKAEEHATHYLHLMATPCAQCRGPVVIGRIGKRVDRITKETELTEIGAICLLCGSRPEGPINPTVTCHFRPVEWEWKDEMGQRP